MDPNLLFKYNTDINQYKKEKFMHDSHQLELLQTSVENNDHHVLSVTQLSNILKRHVESKFLNIKVKAELSGYKKHTSGHAYFTLKDKDAVIDGVMWRGTSTKTNLEDGMNIIAQGRITTYPMRSKYQMIVEHIEAVGQGDLMKLLLERKEKLQKDGFFDKKNHLPKFPSRIGVITSETGAVIKDILHRIQDRYPCHVLLFPTLVQGNGAAQQVASAITFFNALTENKPDILIVARGGGSFEDLWAFNEECVVHAIYHSKIPVISAIGHETDVTLADFAADLRAPTPTAAAEMATPVLLDIISNIHQITKQLINGYQRIIENSHLRYRLLSQRLKDPQTYLNEKIQKFDDFDERFQKLKKSILIIYFQRYQVIANRLISPQSKIDFNQEKLSGLSTRFLNVYKNFIQQKELHLLSLKNRLEQGSYQRTLEKGFFLIIDEQGKIPQNINDLSENQVINIVMNDGKVRTKLTEIEKIT